MTMQTFAMRASLGSSRGRCFAQAAYALALTAMNQNRRFADVAWGLALEAAFRLRQGKPMTGDSAGQTLRIGVLPLVGIAAFGAEPAALAFFEAGRDERGPGAKGDGRRAKGEGRIPRCTNCWQVLRIPPV